VGPHTPGGLSLFLVDPSPGGGLGALAQWRRAAGAGGLGYRLGVAEDRSGEVSVFGGMDLSGLLATGVEESEIDVVWWSGAGLGVGEDVVVSVPLGLMVGWRGLGDGTVFAPHGGAHVVLDIADEVELEGALDLGLDLTLASGWVVRFAASFGGREAIAIGVRVPSGASD
jgi:hypothetical protein